MGYRLTFTLPGHPENDNQRRRWHWSQRSEHDAQWKQDSHWASLSAKQDAESVGVPFPLHRVDVRYTFIKPTRRAQDTDNAGSSTKPILDGIVSAGVIPDDTDKYVRYVCTGIEYEKGVREVRVEITEVEDEA
jgi:hypothetical protein